MRLWTLEAPWGGACVRGCIAGVRLGHARARARRLSRNAPSPPARSRQLPHPAQLTFQRGDSQRGGVRAPAANPPPMGKAQPAIPGRVQIPMRRLLCTVLALAFTASLAGDAAARSGSCLVPGNTTPCKVWNGRVTSIDDGDTIRVDVAGDRTRASIRVRLIGIQAMEQTVYSSSCVTPARRMPCGRGDRPARAAAQARRLPRQARRSGPVEPVGRALAPLGRRQAPWSLARRRPHAGRRGARAVAAELGRVRLERPVQPACGARRRAAAQPVEHDVLRALDRATRRRCR